MYRTLYAQLVDSVGHTLAPWMCIAISIAIFLAVQVLVSRTWRQRMGVLQGASGWRGLLATLTSNSLRVTTGIVGVGILGLALLMQASLYAERNGRVTQRNYDAVKSKWGVAHEQCELKVPQYVYEIETEEAFANGSSRQVRADAEPPTTEQTEAGEEGQVLSDETFNVDLDEKGTPKNPMAVARRVKKLVRRSVGRDALVGAKIDIQLKSSPRYLGGAAYAGFEDECRFQYDVENRGERATRAAFRFPLPGEGQGLFNRLSVKLDGQDLGREVRYMEDGLCWERNLTPGVRHKVEIAYASRGLESFRYWPGNMREQYTVQMRVVGVPAERLNFPIGAMSPSDELSELSGEDYTLHWDLSKAVTNYAMGLIVPAPRQPGVEVGRLLREAPLGVALLALLLVVTRLLLGAPVSLLAVGLSLLIHFLGYTTLAYVSEYGTVFTLVFLASMLVPSVVGAVYWIALDGRNFAGIQSAVLFMLFTIGYPLAVYLNEHTGTVLNSAYVLLTAYLMLLAVRAARQEKIAGAEAQSAPAGA